MTLSMVKRRTAAMKRSLRHATLRSWSLRASHCVAWPTRSTRMRSREHLKALFDGHNGPERGLLLAPLALLLLYDQD